MLIDRNGLTCKGSLLGLHACTFNNTSVCRNRVTCFQNNYVTRNQILTL